MFHMLVIICTSHIANTYIPSSSSSSSSSPKHYKLNNFPNSTPPSDRLQLPSLQQTSKQMKPNNKSFDSPQHPLAHLYEPTSVLDHHLTSSPAATTAATNTTHHHHAPPPSEDNWDPLLSFFNPVDSFDSFELDLDLDIDLDHPTTDHHHHPLTNQTFDRSHLELLLKAAAFFESNDLYRTHVILSRLNHDQFPTNSPLQRAASHFKDALLSLLPIPNPPQPSPPQTPLEIVNSITAHKSFSDLSPVPQFTSFTANQTILESLLDSSTGTNNNQPQTLHVIDFDIGLGGQWSSFAQEIASRSKSLRCPPPRIRITAIVADETVETVLAAENLRDFGRAIGVHVTVGFVHVGKLGALALGRVRVVSGEAVAVVLTPAIFRLVGDAPENFTAVMMFVRGVSPRIVVFVDTECFGNSSWFRRSFASGLEFYASMMEAVDAAAAATYTTAGEEVEVVVRRVEEKVMRPRIFAAVAGWAPREGSWREILAGNGMSPAGFSEFTESQAEWLLRRAPVEGFHVARREGAMVLSWRGRELASTSAWRC